MRVKFLREHREVESSSEVRVYPSGWIGHLEKGLHDKLVKSEVVQSLDAPSPTKPKRQNDPNSQD